MLHINYNSKKKRRARERERTCARAHQKAPAERLTQSKQSEGDLLSLDAPTTSATQILLSLMASLSTCLPKQPTGT